MTDIRKLTKRDAAYGIGYAPYPPGISAAGGRCASCDFGIKTPEHVTRCSRVSGEIKPHYWCRLYQHRGVKGYWPQEYAQEAHT